MTIPLNDRPELHKPTIIKGMLDGFWKDARNTKLASSNDAYVKYWQRATKSRDGLTKFLDGATLASLEVPFRSVYAWDAPTWSSFSASALSVYATLVPAALAEIASHKVKLLDTDVDPVTGDVVYNSPLSAPEIAAVNATLQAIEDEYSLT